MADDEHRGNGRPLTGVVLCSTSVAQDKRGQLADYAVEMGAIHKLDLTADVTHLIVGDIKTPKYRYVAKSRPDIKVLQPEWIEEVRQQWLSGDDVNIEALEEQYRMPTLSGLHVCVTGFVDAETRNELERIVKEHGATYSGDLTKQVTHLIVAVPQGAKYIHAKQWNIPCIGQKWLSDSIKRRMALDESLYDPTLPEEEQGKGAFRMDIERPASTTKRIREEQDDLRGKRKFRRTASTKLEEHSQDLWQDISAVEGISEPPAANQWNESDAGNKTPVIATTSVQPIAQPVPASKLFSGWRICIQGFDKERTKKLKNVLTSACGADIVDNASELRLSEAISYCILVPHQPPESLQYLSHQTAGTIVATEWWVERCIFQKTIISLSDDVLSGPFWKEDLPDMSGLHIASTGLNGMDLRQISQVIKVVGATYEENLSPTTSVLISGGTALKKEKAYYAHKHKIPVVTTEWLWSSIKSKRRDSFKPFQISSKPELTPQTNRGSLSGSSRLQRQRIGPFVHEDPAEDQTVPAPQPDARPLTERSPNMSPRKSPSKPPELKEQQTKSSDTIEMETRSPQNLAEDISSLSRQLRASRAASSTNEDTNPRRKKRTLGRAASAISNRSISAEVSIDERLDHWGDEAPEEEPQPQGTQLGYEVPEVEAHRVQMALKLGDAYLEEPTGRRLESLGTVKDIDMPVKTRRQKHYR